MDYYKQMTSPFMIRKNQQQQQAILEIGQRIKDMNLKLIVKGDQIN